MPSTKSFLYRGIRWLKSKPEQPAVIEPAQNPPRIVGAYREDGQWRICPSDYKEEGRRIYQVVLGQKALDQYSENLLAYNALQSLISDSVQGYSQPRRSKDSETKSDSVN
jgi:hypothetical protein